MDQRLIRYERSKTFPLNTQVTEDFHARSSPSSGIWALKCVKCGFGSMGQMLRNNLKGADI